MAKTEKKPAGKDAGAPSAAQRKVVSKTGAEIRGIVRIAGKDMAGEMPLSRALVRVKGVGERLAPVCNAVISRELKIPGDIYVGELSEEQIDRIEGILSTPQKYGVPVWMTNRRKDVETGLDKHLIGTDLTFTVRQDIDREKNMNSWIGYRHNYGQKVRGQHTRTTGRAGMTVGVLRKAILAKQGAAAAAPASGAPAAAAPAKKEEKK
ncbi:MAG: 30S ribosomal protein S13 [Candidatus ainarchaeum sp.]|nr:30S ribosomal protein S13 [Candidatus ainarchaeum sp.]